MFEKEELKNYLEKANLEILFAKIFFYGGKTRIFIISKKLSA